jgi:hypothetical protein
MVLTIGSIGLFWVRSFLFVHVRTHTLYYIFNVNQPHQGIDVFHPSLLEEEKRQLIKALA